MQFCELVKCGGEVVIIISHRLEINQAKLGGEPLHLVKLDCGTSPSLSYGYERSPKVIRKLFANCGPFVMLQTPFKTTQNGWPATYSSQ